MVFDKYEAIIFDLDGTLVDSMWIWKAIDIDFLGKRNMELPNDLQKSIEGMSFTETAIYFKKRFDLNESLEEIKKEWNELAYDYYKNKIKLKKNVKKVLEILKKQGKIIGIGTSNSRMLAELVIKHNGVKEYFDILITSCDVNKGKPSPDVFLKVAEMLNVEPEKCLVFEDTYAGVQAAIRANMDCFAIYDEIASESEEDIIRTATRYLQSYDEIV
jgi:HAD superfamily hydrolase (TIGR01509 family)